MTEECGAEWVDYEGQQHKCYRPPHSIDHGWDFTGESLHRCLCEITWAERPKDPF